jgi:hypothetical protein
MKVKFKDLLSYCRASKAADTTFVFYSKDYAFPVAELFSSYLEKTLNMPALFYSTLQEPSDGEIALYGSCVSSSVSRVLKISHSKVESPRLISFLSGELDTKGSWGSLSGSCVMVEVPEVSIDTVEDDLRYLCAVTDTPYADIMLRAAKPKVSEGWGFLIKMVLPLRSTDILFEDNSYIATLYQSLEDKVIYGSKVDAAAAMVSTAEQCLEFNTRLINSLAVYHSVVVMDEAGLKAKEISLLFGIDENSLRNRLIPRLRVTGRARLLRIIDKLSEAHSKVIEGVAISDIPLHMSAVLLSNM